MDEKLIQKWLDEGTISKKQADKMLSDIRSKGNRFIAIISIIGAVLIFVGFAWLIARNWHQIPDVLKVLILLTATLGAFASGVISREKKHEGVGRALITLGALLYILSLFLISQIYNLATTPQHYAWLMFLAWSVIMLTAYLLDSIENVVVGMICFVIWTIVQYFAQVQREPEVFGFVLIFLGIGVIMYSVYLLHKKLSHKFMPVYRFWTVFYILALFYIMSFQVTLPYLSEYNLSMLTSFVIVLFAIAVAAFIGAALFKGPSYNMAGFAGLIIILVLLVLATKVGAGLVGYCQAISCYELTRTQCDNAQPPLYCEWQDNQCMEQTCWDLKTEQACLNREQCIWDVDTCIQSRMAENLWDICSDNNNMKEECDANALCRWRPGGSPEDNLPTSLWLLWILNNFIFIGVIILMIWFGQKEGSGKIVSLSLYAFILEIISRYIGFWMDFEGYLAFSILAIAGGAMLIAGAYYVPKWRKKLLSRTK